MVYYILHKCYYKPEHNLWLRQIEGREGQTEGGGKQDGWLANQQTKPNKKTLQRVFKIY